jgi:5-methylcytosine-specific restriction endonuclease McrA
MTWFKIDDGFWSHPKVLELSDEAVALWVRAGSYCAGHLTDGVVKRGTLRLLGATRDAATELVLAGLWDIDGETWTFHDWDVYQPTRQQVEATRASDQRRQELSRNPQLRDAIRSRDGGACRYCGIHVNWADRKGTGGGTYDHINPYGPNTLENLVVACRACNSKKGQRTPEQAGMRIRPVSGSDLVTNQAPSRPVPTRPLTDYVSQSGEDRQAEQRSAAIIQGLGIDPKKLRTHIEAKAGTPASATEAMRIATEILARGGDVTHPQRYVLSSITKNPDEIRTSLRATRPASRPEREPECDIHTGYPLPCHRCAQEQATP